MYMNTWQAVDVSATHIENSDQYAIGRGEIPRLKSDTNLPYFQKTTGTYRYSLPGTDWLVGLPF